MAVVKKKPTSPGRRFVVQVINHDLHKGAPHGPLLEKQSKSGGRNNQGLAERDAINHGIYPGPRLYHTIVTIDGGG